MKAMIFAAGLGTRLQHLTQHTPKALVKFGGKPLLEHVIAKLKEVGVDKIIINVHHYAEQIIDFIHANDSGINIQFSIEENCLLDTGGGLKKASWFFDDEKPFFIHNVDVQSDLNLLEMYNFHCRNNALASLAVRNRDTQRYFLFDKKNRLCGRENLKINEKILFSEMATSEHLHRFAFSGIHVVSPKIFDYMPKEEIFPIINLYKNVNKQVFAYPHDYGKWKDMGKIEDFFDE